MICLSYGLIIYSTGTKAWFNQCRYQYLLLRAFVVFRDKIDHKSLSMFLITLRSLTCSMVQLVINSWYSLNFIVVALILPVDCIGFCQ